MNNGEQQAFPLTTDAEIDSEVHEGLSKREYFAAMAMQGILANSPDWSEDQRAIDWVARNAVKYGDAVLAELSKPQQ